MAKSFKIGIIIVVVLVFVGIGVWIGLVVAGSPSGMSGQVLSPYSAVYLSTGDVYFGKLEWFPSPHIEDAWFLQRGTDANGNPTLSVYPFSGVAWGPASAVYFDSRQIVFWTRLSADSRVVSIMENPQGASSAIQSGSVEPQNLDTPSGMATTSTSNGK